MSRVYEYGYDFPVLLSDNLSAVKNVRCHDFVEHKSERKRVKVGKEERQKKGREEERNAAAVHCTVAAEKESILSVFCSQSSVMQMTSAIPQG